MSRHATATILTGVLIVVICLVTLGQVGSSLPEVFVPASIILVIPQFLHVPLFVLPFCIVALFWLWSYPLFGGAAHVPLRTTLLIPLVGALSLAYFVSNWRYGIKYQGPVTVVFAALSATLALASLLTLALAKRAPSFRRSLVLHALLFAWALTYAFPYLGEWP